MTVWVVVARSCESCGGEAAVRVLDRQPTDAEVRECKDEVGGMWCITTAIVEAEVSGPIVAVEGPQR